MASPSTLLKVALRNPVCLKGLDENELRLLVEELFVLVTDPNFSGFVLSDKGVQVRFNSLAGDFGDVTWKAGGEDVVIIPGLNQKGLEIFEGPPTNTNPGVGWQVDVERTMKIFAQPTDQSKWTVFFAKRVPVLNVFEPSA